MQVKRVDVCRDITCTFHSCTDLKKQSDVAADHGVLQLASRVWMFTVWLAQYYQKRTAGRNVQEVIRNDNEEWEHDHDEVDPELKSQFRSASSFLPSIMGELERKDLMEFYAFYKQATCGVAKPTDRPPFFDIKGKAKYDAWVRLGDMTPEEAMRSYVAKMVAMNVGWDSSSKSTARGFGNRPSRPAAVSESSDGSFTSVSDREALLWFTAAKADDDATVMDILNRRPEILNEADQHLGMTALHWAIDSGCDKVIRLLMSKDVDVNAIDPEGNTPLHFAAYCHREDAAKQLIAKGADRTVCNNDGLTAAEVCDEPTLRALLASPSV
ncbi:hypothetical protein Q1695_014950 [Nippostrongylus brasiliensis]|nr:hypothetical protein Q1695_014950 [Nippostrongylus brasiliensis]